MILELKNFFGDFIYCMWDIIRGGLGIVLNEVLEIINIGIKI